jgi:hypothetical protein
MKKPVTSMSGSLMLKKLKEWGEERATAAIYHTMEKGWKNIFEPGNNQTSG